MKINVEVDWTEAPDWANYFAIDQSGLFYWYEYAPKLSIPDRVWLPDNKDDLFNSTNELSDNSIEINVDNWKDSLQQRPVIPFQYKMGDKVRILKHPCSEHVGKVVTLAVPYAYGDVKNSWCIMEDYTDKFDDDDEADGGYFPYFYREENIEFVGRVEYNE